MVSKETTAVQCFNKPAAFFSDSCWVCKSVWDLLETAGNFQFLFISLWIHRVTQFTEVSSVCRLQNSIPDVWQCPAGIRCLSEGNPDAPRSQRIKPEKLSFSATTAAHVSSGSISTYQNESRVSRGNSVPSFGRTDPDCRLNHGVFFTCAGRWIASGEKLIFSATSTHSQAAESDTAISNYYCYFVTVTNLAFKSLRLTVLCTSVLDTAKR